jgi:hypothetical protein
MKRNRSGRGTTGAHRAALARRASHAAALWRHRAPPGRAGMAAALARGRSATGPRFRRIRRHLSVWHRRRLLCGARPRHGVRALRAPCHAGAWHAPCTATRVRIARGASPPRRRASRSGPHGRSPQPARLRSGRAGAVERQPGAPLRLARRSGRCGGLSRVPHPRRRWRAAFKAGVRHTGAARVGGKAAVRQRHGQRGPVSRGETTQKPRPARPRQAAPRRCAVALRASPARPGRAWPAGGCSHPV